MVAAPPPVVTTAGVRGVTPGMTAAVVSKAWKTPLSLVGAPGSPCATAAIRVGKATGYALFRNGRFAAVFFEAGAATDRGVRIGTKARKLPGAYPGIAQRGDAFFVAQLRFDVDARGTVTRIGYGDVRTTSCI
jgi:hypothetical protein